MFIFISFLLLISAFISNNYITISRHTLTSQKLKKTSSLSIIHISDLHNKNFGHRQSYLIKKIRLLKPDLIAVSGDLIDNSAYKNALTFIQKASEICPIYYVRGNHESLAGNFANLKKELLKYHVTILKNETAAFTKDNITYHITGLDDPIFRGYNKKYKSYVNHELNKLLKTGTAQNLFAKKLSVRKIRHMPDKAYAKKASKSHDIYQILLSHRPELFHIYSSYPFDLVLCGHAHGGQIRPPFTDGLYAPNQGIFPRYTSGSHTKNGTTEIISRGLGNSGCPLRLLNYPEIVHIVIKPN